MSRTKGSQNIKTIAWTSLGNYILNNGSKRLLDVMNKMEDEEFVKTYVKMLSYFKPRQVATTIKQDGDISLNIVHDNPDILKEI